MYVVSRDLFAIFKNPITDNTVIARLPAEREVVEPGNNDVELMEHVIHEVCDRLNIQSSRFSAIFVLTVYSIR